MLLRRRVIKELGHRAGDVLNGCIAWAPLNSFKSKIGPNVSLKSGTLNTDYYIDKNNRNSGLNSCRLNKPGAVGIPYDYNSQASSVNQFSICIWYKLNKTSDEFREIVSNLQNGGWQIAQATNNKIRWQIWCVPNDGSAANYQYLYSITIIQNTNWHFLVGTYNGSYMQLYIDGKLDNSMTVPASACYFKPNTPIGFGNNPADPNILNEGSFSGNIQNYRCYNRVLSAAEVKKLYDIWK